MTPGTQIEIPIPIAESPRLRNPAWKRTLDLTCLIVAMPLVLPLMLAIAALIKCVSRGSVLFRQLRIGFNGQPFLCYKFRTMHPNAKEAGHAEYTRTLIAEQKPMIKMDDFDDERLIRGAPFLRATGLDELPQLYNVLRGEMSLVGPRPCTPYEWDNYLPWHKSRFQSLPGLTGLWQVSGKNETTFDQMVAFDIDYASRRSLGLDLRILLKTFRVICRQVKALVIRKAARASRYLKILLVLS